MRSSGSDASVTVLPLCYLHTPQDSRDCQNSYAWRLILYLWTAAPFLGCARMFHAPLMEDKQILCLSQNSSFLVPENDTAALIGNKPDHRIWGHRRCAQKLQGSWCVHGLWEVWGVGEVFRFLSQRQLTFTVQLNQCPRTL